MTYDLSNKKIAIVFDDLIQKGGAENLLKETLSIFPHADLYTSVISKEWKKTLLDKNVYVSFMQKLPFAISLNRFYSIFMFHTLAFSQFNFDDYDLVLSISSRYAHHIITKPKNIHVCYINSPGRMFWEPYSYFENQNFLIKIFSIIPISILRLFDYCAAQRVDHFISNSITPQKRVKKYYQKESQIIYPFANITDVSKEIVYSGDYFLIISRLQTWKKIDIAIKACEELDLPLKIVGEGPDINRLKSISKKPTTQFLGYVSSQKKKELLVSCKALINTQLEDFGIVPVEALSCGKPVIAFGKGGVLETIEPKKTGEFFYEQSSDSLKEVLEHFDPKIYTYENCITSSQKFGITIFRRNLQKSLYEFLFNR